MTAVSNEALEPGLQAFFFGVSIVANIDIIGGDNSTAAIAAHVNEALEPVIQALRIDFGVSSGAIAVGEENTGMELLDSDLDIILLFGASTVATAADIGHNKMKSAERLPGRAVTAQLPRENCNYFSISGLCALLAVVSPIARECEYIRGLPNTWCGS